MKKLLQFLVLLITFCAYTQTFTELNTANLMDLFNSSAVWGDYDNDGDLDVLLTGLDSHVSNRKYSKIYTNNNGTFTELTSANLPGVAFGQSAWGDYDNDGDLDILLTGQSVSGNISKIYTNTAGVFTELITANLTGVGGSSVAWGDYDNDGDLDILLTGGTSKIYTNKAGTFTELATANLPRIDNGSVAWGDYDNDGDLDILLTGFTGSVDISKIYTNTGGVFTELVTANLTGVSFSAVAWGDYDNDGDLDILLTGYTGSTTISKIYTNNGGVFTELITANLPGLQHSSAAWGDYDNDGDLDILLTGIGGSTEISKIYTNTAGTFAELTAANLTGVRYGSATWGDYDNDDDLDILLTGEITGGRISKIYTNNTLTPNTIPTAPTNPTAVVNGNEVTLSWTASTDAETPSSGLSYNVYIKENPVGSPIYVKTPMAQENDGWRKLPAIGNTGQNTSYIWKLPEEYHNTNKDFTFKIQAIDHSFAGSEFSTEGTFSIVDLRKFIELDTANLTNVFQSAVAWGDYDNDGDLDLLVTGKKSISVSTDPISTIYTNTNGTFTALATANLIGVQSGAVEWGDYDNDGDLDILLTGLATGNINVAKIYTNNGGSFTELATANLPGIAFGDVAWGDYDNDGDLDIFLTGGISKIFTNDAGTFTELATASFPRLSSGSVDWGDYDNDGDLDILLTGYTGSLDISKIYTNTNGVFTELTSANLTGVSYSSTAWGDYDNDGDLDVLLSGYTGSARVTKIYTNTAGSFTELATANLLGVQEGSIAWGDYDNDGDLDILLTGSGGSASTRIYTNNAGVFTHLITNDLPGLVVSDAVWGDYDNDGDLDIALAGVTNSSFFSKIFTNNIATANTAPTAPTNPTAVVNGDEVTLSWTASTDTETPSNGLSYNVYIKDASASSAYTVSPMAQENDGWRKLPAIGNAGQGTSYLYKFPAACTADYTFKVQAIDHNFAGSPFSAEGSFSTVDTTKPTVVTQDITVQLDASGNTGITAAQIDNGSSDACGIQSMSLDITSFDCTLVGTNTVTLTVTDVNGNSDTQIATVTLEDKVVPSIVTQDITMQLDASGNASITPAQIDNGSSDACGIQSMSLDITSFDCTLVGTNTVSLTVTDVNGNSDTQTATVTIEDKVVPTIVTQDITIQLDASRNVNITSAQIDNGSSDACGIQSMSLDITTFDCTHIGINTVTLTVIDVNGNFASNTATVTVEDNSIPHFAGPWGTGTLADPFTTISEGILKYLPSGRYYFSFNNATFLAELDNDTDGGAWLMVLNYVHLAGDNPALEIRNTDLPLLDSSTLGDNEANTANWGHIGNTLAAALDFKELRFYGKTTGHSREIHFKTQYIKAINYIKTGVGDFRRMGHGNYTTLVGHTANLPQSMGWGHSDQGDLALTNFPFYLSNQYHWGIKGVGSRWEVDDFARNAESTIHRVWVRGDSSPAVTLPLVTVALDATGNAAVSPNDFGLTAQDNCGGVITQTLSKTDFDCTNFGENIVQLHATDAEGNIGIIDVTVIVGDPIAPVLTCSSDITVETDPGACEATVTVPVPAIIDNCALPPATIPGFTTIGVKGGSTYYVSNTNFTGPEAFADAKAKGGYVATIETAEEDQFITDYQAAQGLSDITIGLYDLTFSGTFVWHSQSTATYTNWNSSEPNNIGREEYTEKVRFNGSWNNIPRSVSQPYILEIKGGLERTDALVGESVFLVGDHTIEYTVTDAAGNTDSCSFTITVEDNEPINIQCIAPFVVNLDVTGSASITARDIDNGSTDNCGITSIAIDKTNFDCTQLGDHTVTLTATNSHGHQASCTTTVTVADNTPPLFANPWGTGRLTDPFTTISQDVLKNVPSGRYYFNFNNSTFQAELDNDTDGGGWLMVLNYVRKADDNPDIQIRNTDLPLLTSSILNDDESNTSYWGHIGNTLASAINFNELRFYATTTGHNREIHFKTQHTNAIEYVKTGTGNFHGMNQGNFTALTGHTSNLPQMMNGGFSDQGDMALTNFPFYNGGTYHWGIKGIGRRWEVDDFSINAESTIHRVWIRSNETLSFIAPAVTIALGATGNATLTPAHYGLNPIENCGGTVTQTLSKTDFDCTEIGEHTLQLTATDARGNSSTIAIKVTIEDTNPPVMNCVAPFTLQLDALGMATLTAADIDNGSTGNCGIASMSIDQTTFDCSQLGDHVVTLTVTDVSGNVNTCSTTVTIVDMIAPIATCVAPFTVPLDATGNAVISPQDINLGSTDECNLASLQIDRQRFTLDDLGEQMITLTVTDHGGNTSSCTTIITVVDVTPPVITLVGDDPQIILLGDSYEELGATTDDESSVSIDSSAYQSEVGEYIIRYSATDPSGNRSEVTRRVIVQERDEFVFEIYPNPAIDHFLIIGSKDMYFFEIYDIAGRKIQSYPKEFVGQRIPVDQYPPGMYWVKAYFQSKDSRFEQIMVKNR